MTDTTRRGRLSGRTALITGASRGIGRAIAQAFADEGAHLFLTATNAAKLEETQALCADAGGELAGHIADVSDPDSAQAMFDTAVAWRGGLDIVVNNAGIYIGKRFVDYELAELDRVMKVNVYAVFQLTQLAVRHMRARGGGKIVNMASTAGKWESPNQAVYNTSKHAVVGLTRCAALETATDGINVNAICPGFVSTGMFDGLQESADAQGVSVAELQQAIVSRVPMGRLVTGEEVAHLAVYLASSESDGMTGQSIPISGGMRMG